MMTSDTFTAITHQYHTFCSPVHEAQVEEIINLLPLEPGTTVFDAGCGKAEILIRVAQRCQVQALGIDPTEELIHGAHEALSIRAPGADIAVEHQHPRDHIADAQSYDVGINVNASQLYGGYEKALLTVSKLVRAGGMLLMGQFYWLQPPTTTQEDIAEATYYDYANTIQRGIEQGLVPLYVSTSLSEDLDRYYWLQTYAAEQYAAKHPDADDTQQLLTQARQRRDIYLSELRGVLGFGLFLFRKSV